MGLGPGWIIPINLAQMQYYSPVPSLLLGTVHDSTLQGLDLACVAFCLKGTWNIYLSGAGGKQLYRSCIQFMVGKPLFP